MDMDAMLRDEMQETAWRFPCARADESSGRYFRRLGSRASIGLTLNK